MSSNELFYGDAEPVWVVDSAPYPVRRGRASSYDSEKYYASRPTTAAAGYYRAPSYGRSGSGYYSGDRASEYEGGYRSSSRHSNSDYYHRDSYTADPYLPSSSPASTYGAAYDDTYFDSRPNEYYDYRRPSTVVLKVPICCEACSEEARNSLFELRGVRAVYCDVRRERVTVTGTAAPADVLQVLRKLHKKSRFWGDEDYYY